MLLLLLLSLSHRDVCEKVLSEKEWVASRVRATNKVAITDAIQPTTDATGASHSFPSMTTRRFIAVHGGAGYLSESSEKYVQCALRRSAPLFI